jgi:hypothetical protein
MRDNGLNEFDSFNHLDHLHPDCFMMSYRLVALILSPTSTSLPFRFKPRDICLSLIDLPIRRLYCIEWTWDRQKRDFDRSSAILWQSTISHNTPPTPFDSLPQFH